MRKTIAILAVAALIPLFAVSVAVGAEPEKIAAPKAAGKPATPKAPAAVEHKHDECPTCQVAESGGGGRRWHPLERLRNRPHRIRGWISNHRPHLFGRLRGRLRGCGG